jgi:ABC-type uncharacterized transport system permease subunit
VITKIKAKLPKKLHRNFARMVTDLLLFFAKDMQKNSVKKDWQVYIWKFSVLLQITAKQACFFQFSFSFAFFSYTKITAADKSRQGRHRIFQ